MAESNVNINGVEATLFKDTDPPIYVMPDGRFAVRYGGVWKVRSSIAPLLKVIGRHNTPVKMMHVYGLCEPSVETGRGPEVIEAVSWERGFIGLADGKRRKDGWRDWYAYDAKIVAELDALYAEVQKVQLEHQKAIRLLVKKHDNICKRIKPIDEESFRAVLAETDAIRPRHGRAKGVRRGEA